MANEADQKGETEDVSRIFTAQSCLMMVSVIVLIAGLLILSILPEL